MFCCCGFVSFRIVVPFLPFFSFVRRVTAGAGRLSEIERLYASSDGGGGAAGGVDGSEDSDCDDGSDHHKRGGSSSVGTGASEVGMGQAGRGVSGGRASVTFSEGGGGFGGGGHAGESKSDSVRGRASRVLKLSYWGDRGGVADAVW